MCGVKFTAIRPQCTSIVLAAPHQNLQPPGRNTHTSVGNDQGRVQGDSTCKVTYSRDGAVVLSPSDCNIGADDTFRALPDWLGFSRKLRLST